MANRQTDNKQTDMISHYFFQVKSEHRPLVQNLLPLLETLAEDHPLGEVKDMANDLRIAIATHGAVWSHKMNDAARNLGKQTDTAKMASDSACEEGGTSNDAVVLPALKPCMFTLTLNKIIIIKLYLEGIHIN